MIKVFAAILLLILQACASAPAPRPKAIEDAEFFMQQGTASYFHDDYPSSAINYAKALKVYQSIDDQKGVVQSRINLLETTLAIGNLSLAEDQLQRLKQATHDSQLDTRILLLEVKLLFLQNKYELAIQLITPNLPGFNEQQQLQNKNMHSLNLTASMTRLAVVTKSDQSGLWLKRFGLAIDNESDNLRYQALWFRMRALDKQHHALYAQSEQLLQQALSLSQQQTYRRGIAASLQQWADLKIELENLNEANELLQRALNIHLWTLNKPAAITVIRQLVKVNNLMGNTDQVASYQQQLLTLQ